MYGSIYDIRGKVHTDSTDLAEKCLAMFHKCFARRYSRQSFSITKWYSSYSLFVIWSVFMMVTHSLSWSNSLEADNPRSNRKCRKEVCSFFVELVIGTQRVVAIQCQSWSICIEEFIRDFEHRCAIADMSPFRSKSGIQDFIIHAFETCYLISQCRIRDIICIEKMRHYSLDNQVRMTL